MPRRTTVPRKLKYEVVPENKTIDRFVVKVMLSGKRGLAERILRETLVRLEAQASRPGLEVLDLALRNATPLIEVKPRHKRTVWVTVWNNGYTETSNKPEWRNGSPGCGQEPIACIKVDLDFEEGEGL